MSHGLRTTKVPLVKLLRSSCPTTSPAELLSCEVHVTICVPSKLGILGLFCDPRSFFHFSQVFSPHDHRTYVKPIFAVKPSLRRTICLRRVLSSDAHAKSSGRRKNKSSLGSSSLYGEAGATGIHYTRSVVVRIAVSALAR